MLYKRWSGTQDTAHQGGAAGGFRACGIYFPTSSTWTGLGPARSWGWKSRLRELGVAEHSRGWRAGREGKSQSSGEERGEFLGPEASGQGAPLRNQWGSLSSCLPPSLSYFVNLLSILISGVYKHRHNAVCFSNLKTDNLPPLTFYKWRINGRLFILKFWNSQPQHWWLTNG